MRLSLFPCPSRHLLAPWTPSALPLAVLSPPSWDPMPSRYHSPFARRSATASMPPTHEAMTGGYWHRSCPWTGKCSNHHHPGPLFLKDCQAGILTVQASFQLGCPWAIIPSRSGAGFGCAKSENPPPLRSNVLRSLTCKRPAHPPSLALLPCVGKRLACHVMGRPNNQTGP
jgi:hypothetical protein